MRHTEGRKPSMVMPGAEARAVADGQTKAEGPWLIKAMVERNNLWQAYERVMRNEGTEGVDRLELPEFKAWLQQHWPSVKAALLAGVYLPSAVRKVEISGSSQAERGEREEP